MTLKELKDTIDKLLIMANPEYVKLMEDTEIMVNVLKKDEDIKKDDKDNIIHITELGKMYPTKHLNMISEGAFAPKLCFTIYE